MRISTPLIHFMVVSQLHHPLAPSSASGDPFCKDALAKGPVKNTSLGDVEPCSINHQEERIELTPQEEPVAPGDISLSPAASLMPEKMSGEVV